MRYILRRLGFYAVAAWASITLNFFLPRLMPGDPASAIFARFQGQMTPEALDALRKAFGLTDEPLIKQYFTYLSHALRGDFGISIAYFPAPVTSVIATGLMWTLLLAGVATIISFGLGSLLGVSAAWRRGGWLDTLLPPALMFVYSFPYFWLAMVALYLLSFRLGWFPMRHAYSDMLAPAWSKPRSSTCTATFFSAGGTMPLTICSAKPSTTAVFPTPASPVRIGLFCRRRMSTSTIWRISSSRP